MPNQQTTSNKTSREFARAIVDALFEGAKVDGKIAELAVLQEQQEMVVKRDFVAEAEEVAQSGHWRKTFSDHGKQILAQVGEQLESLQAASLTPKYTPLYETDEIPEEDFEQYRGNALADLAVLKGRLEALHVALESSFLPYADSIKSDELSEADQTVLAEFCVFAEDLVNTIVESHEIVSATAANEQCVMCLGKVYDTIAKSLSNLEIAGSFVQRMTGALDGAE